MLNAHWKTGATHTLTHSLTNTHSLIHTHSHTHSHTHTHSICNTYCFSTATKVAHTRLNITSQVNCLPCLIRFLSTFTKKSSFYSQKLVTSYIVLLKSGRMYIQAINFNSTQYMLNKLLVSKVVRGYYYNHVQQIL